MKEQDYRTAMRFTGQAINSMLDLAENHLLSFDDIEPTIRLMEAVENILTQDFVGENNE